MLTLRLWCTRPQHSPYNMALLEQMRLCIRRGFQRLRNNWSTPLSSIIGNVVMAVIVSSIFYNLSQTTNSFNNRGVLIFFATLLNAFMSAFEVSIAASHAEHRTEKELSGSANVGPAANC